MAGAVATAACVPRTLRVWERSAAKGTGGAGGPQIKPKKRSLNYDVLLNGALRSNDEHSRRTGLFIGG